MSLLLYLHLKPVNNTCKRGQSHRLRDYRQDERNKLSISYPLSRFGIALVNFAKKEIWITTEDKV